MENCDLALGDVDIIQESVRNLLDHCANIEERQINRTSPSIYMAPSVLRDLSPSSFNPFLVSIGPLHRKDENVQAFEEQKVTYLNKLMRRIGSTQDEILKSCMQKAYTLMNKIKACYVWTVTYDDAEIAKMMVIDTCFILEFILEVDISLYHESYSGKVLQFRTIMNDLVLLENQIPFFFLHEIYQCTILKFASSQDSFINLIKQVPACNNIFESYIETSNVSIDTTHHILGLLHECYKPQASIIPIDSLFTRIRLPSAVDLDMSGVNFKPNQDPTWALGMDVKLYKFLWFFGCYKFTFLLRRRVGKVECALQCLLAKTYSKDEVYLLQQPMEFDCSNCWNCLICFNCGSDHLYH